MRSIFENVVFTMVLCTLPAFVWSCSANSAGSSADASETECPGPELSTLPDALGNQEALQVSEILPGDFIEIYNTTDQPIDLGTGQGYAVYFPVWGNSSTDPWAINSFSLPLPNAIISAKSYMVMQSPGDMLGFGELILYRENWFEGALDYICYGFIPDAVRHGSPEKWEGPCIENFGGGSSITRRSGTSGGSAADYRTDRSPTPLTCAP